TSYVPGVKPWDAADNAVTPRVGIMYDLTDTVALYADAARSFKPNTGASRLGGGFDPEQGKSYEMGIKWEALEQLSVDAAIATGQVRSRGFDLNVAGNLTPEWRVIGGYAYVDAAVTKDTTVRTGTRLANI
ncbi:putative TonB-dependent siderophore receptor, partial [Pseudomonas fluorescens BRIP34879]